MKRSLPIALAVAALSSGAALVDGCSSDAPATGAADASAGDAANDGATTPDAPVQPPPKLERFTFRYEPSWDGVKSVSVVGGFGQTSDWNPRLPLVGLVPDGAGAFFGTVDLPAGDYLYVFRVVGDAAASSTDTFFRYAFDPTSSDYFPCPQQSPTYDKNASNPCSRLTLPQAAAAPTHHVRGTVLVDGQPAQGYLVVVERAESASHAFFEDRATTGTDGAFDLVVAAGRHRLEVLHPTFLKETDALRDPLAENALRRAVSSDFAVAADLTVPSPDLAFHDYAAFAPRDAGTLPTRFTFGDGGASRSLAVYGTVSGGAGPNVGDPWFSSPPTTAGTADFDGGFNTPHAAEMGVALGERYFWGTESAAAGDAGVTWTGQSMVFPITWQ